MIFDKRRYISEIDSSIAFVSIYTALFLLIMFNIWFPYKAQNSVDNIHAVTKTTNLYTLSTTSSSTQSTNTSSSYASYSSILSTSQATLNSISLIKKDIVQSVSYIESIALKQAHAYIIDTVYFINTTYSKNKNFSDKQFKNITGVVDNTLEEKSNIIDQVVEKLNGSSVSINLGNDAESTVKQTDLQSLKLNYTYFDSFLKSKQNIFSEKFSMDNMVNASIYNTNLNHTGKYNLTLNSTQLSAIDLLLSGFFSESAKTKREYSSGDTTTIKSEHKKTIRNLTAIFCSFYVLGIILYFVVKLLLKDRIEQFFLEGQSITNPPIYGTEMKPKKHHFRNYFINIFMFLKTKTPILLIWLILIVEYCFVKYHINITFESQQSSLKKNVHYEKRSENINFASTLSDNIGAFIKFNMFDKENGIIVSYVDKLGIESTDLKTNILSTLKNVVSTSYDTTFYDDFLEGNIRLSLNKRQIQTNEFNLQTLFNTIKQLILKYLRILIAVVSIFVIAQLITFELHIHHF
ncbi:uncharacterized protein HGUI_01366 [Hanseniaspora guilliermondii]|uniref:Uncharacterized protein n=1 Tax=Hanseniaspora guilliermondii TaxID=56406 RepID=A0A1L0FHU8_9ASCO|nr:uncharacterized protein HGUI_01366 [Hanseniaspora guilliermondii]